MSHHVRQDPPFRALQGIPASLQAPSFPRLEIAPPADEEIPRYPAKPKSYEVRLRPGVGDTVWIIGHDRHGNVLVQTQMRRRHLKPGTIAATERWCRENDEPTDIRLA